MALSDNGLRRVTTKINGVTEERTYFWKPAGGPFTVVYSLAAEDAEVFLSAEPLAGEKRRRACFFFPLFLSVVALVCVSHSSRPL